MRFLTLVFLTSCSGGPAVIEPGDTLLGTGGAAGDPFTGDMFTGDSSVAGGDQAVPGRPAVPPTYIYGAARVVAVGDVHGDAAALRSAFMLADLIDGADTWIGGDTVVVQVGDQLDRGDDEREIVDLLEMLADLAHQAGGAVYTLLGNHETMNVELDLRYVTAGGYADFADIPHDRSDPQLAAYPPEQRGRVEAFRPGGVYANILATHNMILVVDDTLFVHGGVLPAHVTYGIEKINHDTQAWMRGEIAEPNIVYNGDSPVWSRHYSQDTTPADCDLLTQVLRALNVARIVVAHTPQLGGINTACNEQAWRVDVGMADYYGGSAAVLEIVAGEPRILQ